jgi:hypothetical protein
MDTVAPVDEMFDITEYTISAIKALIWPSKFQSKRAGEPMERDRP